MVRSGASPRLPAAVAKSLANAAPAPFWLDQPDAPEALPALAEHVTTELAVVGGGFTGLWTALLAKERDPSRDVVLLEARTVGWAASGRNGGFCSASLTHGIGNGLERFPEEMPLLEKLGEQNLREIGETIAKHDIDCDFQLTGELSVATAAWQLEGAEEEAAAARQLGHDVEVLDAEGIRRELNSPTLVGGLKFTTGNALVEPGRLAWGLRRACLEAGVRIYEQTPVRSITPGGTGLTLTTPYGSVRAGKVDPRHRGVRPLAAAPDRRVRDPGLGLRADDGAAVGRAAGRAGLERPARGASDMGNQFHYFRMTRDNRMLWGGYDAVYYNGGGIRDEHALSPAAFGKLAEHFFAAFPQLEGVSFTPRVGRGDRHLQPVLRVLRHRLRRPPGLCGRLHRPRGRCDQVRRAGTA